MFESKIENKRSADFSLEHKVLFYCRFHLGSVSNSLCLFFYVSLWVCWCGYSRGDPSFISLFVFFLNFVKSTVVKSRHENSRALSSPAGRWRRCRGHRRCSHRSISLYSRRDLLLHAIWTKLFCKVHALPFHRSRRHGPGPSLGSKSSSSSPFFSLYVGTLVVTAPARCHHSRVLAEGHLDFKRENLCCF